MHLTTTTVSQCTYKNNSN